MLQKHLQFIDSSTDTQLADTRARLENLLPTLRDPEVRRDTQQLLRAIDREFLDRVMVQANQSAQAPIGLPAAKAA
ncbi:hypothetical protein RQP54_18200 [Curvibacter sp. APW13]|uniref:hypothetical protein n=1 Tax=Curvibacter sp. APW13 TaxID=3077236 RepID=UPI0028DE1C40|nr:hypothetical protein [Curvibacter sp. APW13]MDT8992811.1 hypothetical protein [Curvibacter sp. APW13]